MFVNGKPPGEGKLTRTSPRHGLEPFEVGRDSITPVAPAYKDKGVFAFPGKLEKVAFELSEKCHCHECQCESLRSKSDCEGNRSTCHIRKVRKIH